MSGALKVWGSVVLAAVLIGGATAGYLSWHRAQRAKQALQAETDRFQAAIPVPLRELVKTTTLPQSKDGTDVGDHPNVLINREAIFVDGRRVAALPAGNELKRVDEVSNTLEPMKALWKEQHPGQEFEGVVQYWVDENVRAVQFKSVFQTASFAGYPNGKLVTRSHTQPQQLQGLPIDARVPPPPNEPEPPFLVVKLWSNERVELSWSRSVGSDAQSVPLNELAPAVTQAAKNRPADIAQEQFQQALLLIPHETRVRQLAFVLDAIADTRVAPGPDAHPLFFVTLSVLSPEHYRERKVESAKVRMGAVVVSGRLAPAEIQARVHAAFPVFRGCYEAGLARDPQLAGTVSVRFVIGRDGRVSQAHAAPESTLADREVQRCLVRAFEPIVFPPPDGGSVAVVYPIALTPG